MTLETKMLTHAASKTRGTKKNVKIRFVIFPEFAKFTELPFHFEKIYIKLIFFLVCGQYLSR